MIENYNIVIVGGGPAGIAAGIYGKYDGNNPIILEAETLAWIPENHVNLLTRLEGFPGLLNTVNGTELTERFRHSLSEMGVDYSEHEKVLAIKRQHGNFVVTTAQNTYLTQAVILATGTYPTRLNDDVVGDFKDDVYYFALDNFDKYIGREVVVLGSRNSGSTAALYLARHGVKVTIIEIKPEVQAKEKHTKFFTELGIRTITGAAVTHLNGTSSHLTSLTYVQEGKDVTIPCDALFCYIGITPDNNLARDLGVRLDNQGYAVTDFYQQSNQPGVFLAGDMCGDLKHIIAASGQGAKAAYNVNKYFNKALLSGGTTHVSTK